MYYIVVNWNIQYEPTLWFDNQFNINPFNSEIL